MIDFALIFDCIKSARKSTAPAHYIVTTPKRKVGISTRKLIKGQLVAQYALTLKKIEEDELVGATVSSATADEVRRLKFADEPFMMGTAWQHWYVMNAGKVVALLDTKREYKTVEELVAYIFDKNAEQGLVIEDRSYDLVIDRAGRVFGNHHTPVAAVEAEESFEDDDD